MALVNITLNEVRKRQILYNLYVNIKYNTNESIHKIETDRHRKQTYDYQRGKGRGRERLRAWS